MKLKILDDSVNMQGWKSNSPEHWSWLKTDAPSSLCLDMVEFGLTQRTKWVPYNRTTGSLFVGGKQLWLWRTVESSLSMRTLSWERNLEPTLTNPNFPVFLFPSPESWKSFRRSGDLLSWIRNSSDACRASLFLSINNAYKTQVQFVKVRA